MQSNTYQTNSSETNSELYKKMYKKHLIKKDGNAVGFTVLIAFGLQFFLALVAQIIMQIAAAFGVTAVYDINFVSFLNELIVAFTFIVPFSVCAIIVNRSVSNTVVARGVKAYEFFGATFIAFGFNSLCNIANNMFSNVLKMFGTEPVSKSLSSYSGTENLLISIICTAVLPALIEEFAFRGVVLGILRKNMNDIPAIILSAVIFGVVHGNLVQLPFAVGMGLIFGVVTVYTNSIWPAVAAHFLNNFCSVLLSSSPVENMSISTGNILSVLFYVVSTALAIIGVLMLLKKDKNIFKFSNRSENFSNSESIGIALSTPGMILAIVAYAIDIILLQSGVI